MTPLDLPVAATAEYPIPVRGWLAVVAVAVGIFLLVTAEQLPIGLLTSVGAALLISEGAAGLMVTVPAIVAAISAPLVPVLAGRTDRRVLLVGLMGIMTVANLLSALAPNFAVLLASRVLVGVTIGGFWAIAGGLAVRLVPERAVPRSTAIIFGGVAAGNVLGVPIGTLIGGLTGWRTAFGALGGLALVVLIALFVLLPGLAATQPVGLRELARQLRNRGVLAGIIATFLLVTGHFAAYTFVSPILHDMSGIDESLISLLLFGFGAAGIIGNFVVGAALARTLRRTMLVIIVALATAMLLFPLLGTTTIGGVLLLILWGLAFGGVSVSLQTWMIKAAPRAVEAASALWVSAFNLSIGLGALIGGAVVDSVGLSSVPWLGGALVLLTTLAMWGIRTTSSLA